MQKEDFMRRNLKLIALILLFSVVSCSFTTKSFDDPDKDKVLLDLISYVLARGHYDAKDMNDTFSQEVFDDYIDALDPHRHFFYEKDIAEFELYKNKIDDAIREKDLAFFDLTYNRLMERVVEAEEIQQDILKDPFDYEVEELLNTNYDELKFPKSKRDLKNRWRQQLKYDALRYFFSRKEDQDLAQSEGNEYKGIF